MLPSCDTCGVDSILHDNTDHSFRARCVYANPAPACHCGGWLNGEYHPMLGEVA